MKKITLLFCASLLLFIACNQTTETAATQEIRTRGQLLLNDVQGHLKREFQLPEATIFHSDLGNVTKARMNDSAFLAMTVVSLPNMSESEYDTLYGVYFYEGGDTLDANSYRFIKGVQQRQ